MRALILLLAACCASATPQTGPSAIDAQAKELFSQEHWPELIQLAEATPQRSADLDYYYGLALAHLERWDDAHRALLSGSRRQPRDKRFPAELAGVDFKQKKYAAAAGHLRRALRLDPHDRYAAEFLATVYFLQGNLEAALKYWNRAGKPLIEEVRIEPALRVDSLLLDHAFAFSPAATLRTEDLLATDARLRGLEIFPSYRIDLAARADSKFDAVLHAQERNAWGSSKLQRLKALLLGLPFQQVTPEYFNFQHAAVNAVSLFRWDAEKRRVSAELSGPFARNPKWRFRLGADLRSENWDIRRAFTGPAPTLAALNLRREEAVAEITRLVGGRLSWSAGLGVSRRNYRDVTAGGVLTPSLLTSGYALAQTAQLKSDLLRSPERRFTIGSRVQSEAARMWTSPSQNFARLQAALEPHWFPQAQGDDFETRWRLQAGHTFGQPPFDELFMLGQERDNPLWLRAHIGTHHGRKGSAPLGRNYLLSNWETDKNVYKNGFLALKLGPFVDTGRVTGILAATGPNLWLWDVGAQAKVSVFGVGVTFSYGKDLRTGNNAFYASSGR